MSSTPRLARGGRPSSSIRRITRTLTYIVGAVCAPPTWPKRMWMRPAYMLIPVTAPGVRGGGGQDGIGIHGSKRSRSYRETESSLARSDGDFTHRGVFGTLHMDTAGDAATPSIITSARTITIGATAPTIWMTITHMGSTQVQAHQAVEVSTPGQ